MIGRIAVVAMIDDGTSREVLLSHRQRELMMDLLMQMFDGKSIPVSATELPLEPIEDLKVDDKADDDSDLLNYHQKG